MSLIMCLSLIKPIIVIQVLLSGTVEISGTTYRVFNKFQGTDSLYNQMIPMIRISEMYMIASETSTDGPTRAKLF